MTSRTGAKVLDGKQVSPGDALRAFLSSPPQMAVLAAVCAFLGAVLPVLRITVTGLIGTTGVVPGYHLAGFMTWLTVLAFVAAAAARYVRPLSAYRDLIDLSAFGLLGLAVIWSYFGGPLASEMDQVRQFTGGLGGRPGAMPAAVGWSVSPSIGLLFVVLAPIILFAARRRQSPM